jgi:hypothetical protein
MKGNIEVLSLFVLMNTRKTGTPGPPRWTGSSPVRRHGLVPFALSNSIFILTGARKKTWGCPTGWIVEGAVGLQGFSVVRLVEKWTEAVFG